MLISRRLKPPLRVRMLAVLSVGGGKQVESVRSRLTSPNIFVFCVSFSLYLVTDGTLHVTFSYFFPTKYMVCTLFIVNNFMFTLFTCDRATAHLFLLVHSC